MFEAHHGDEKGELFEIDVRRCRQSAMAKGSFPWPIFSSFDGMGKAVEGELADLSYVVLVKSKKSKLTQLPWIGPAWYAHPNVEWMLHIGLASWQHIKYSFQASSHVAPECLGQVMSIMEKAWAEEDAHLRKFSVNAMVGLLSTQEQCTYSVRTSRHEVDCLGYHMKRLVTFEEGEHTTDYVYAMKLVDNSSWRPTWDFIVAVEHTCVAQMRFIVERLGIPARAIRQIKTDCLVLQPAQKRVPMLMAVSNIQHRDLADLVETYTRLEPGQTRITERLKMTKSKDKTSAFRWTRGPEVKF